MKELKKNIKKVEIKIELLRGLEGEEVDATSLEDCDSLIMRINWKIYLNFRKKN